MLFMTTIKKDNVLRINYMQQLRVSRGLKLRSDRASFACQQLRQMHIITHNCGTQHCTDRIASMNQKFYVIKLQLKIVEHIEKYANYYSSIALFTSFLNY